MVQAEVADRLAATPGSKTYGVPSAKLAWYAAARRAGTVSPTVFWPVPNVESGLVAIERRAQPETTATREQVFAVVDAAFGQRRKMLRSALAGLAGSSAEASAAVEAAGLDPQARGEVLDVTAFARIAEQIFRRVDNLLIFNNAARVPPVSAYGCRPRSTWPSAWGRRAPTVPPPGHRLPGGVAVRRGARGLGRPGRVRASPSPARVRPGTDRRPQPGRPSGQAVGRPVRRGAATRGVGDPQGHSGRGRAGRRLLQRSRGAARLCGSRGLWMSRWDQMAGGRARQRRALRAAGRHCPGERPGRGCGAGAGPRHLPLGAGLRPTVCRRPRSIGASTS